MAIPQPLLMRSAVSASILALAGGSLTGGAEAPESLQPPHAHALVLADRLDATFTEGVPLKADERLCGPAEDLPGCAQGQRLAKRLRPRHRNRRSDPGPGCDPVRGRQRLRKLHPPRHHLRRRSRAARLGRRCPTAHGFRVMARYQVDGDASTGVFAGARGRGWDTVSLQAGRPGRVTITGRLRLRRS